MFTNADLTALVSASLIGLGAVAAVRRIATGVGFVDNPDRWRKLHAGPIPLGGGIAVWLATWSGWALARFAHGVGLRPAGDAAWFLAALAVASFVVLCVGIVDDRSPLRGRYKLAGQAAAAAILAGLGLRIDAFSVFGVTFTFGSLAFPATVLWILVAVNAFNLVDGMDGFCSGLGLIAALGIAAIAIGAGRAEDAVLALALAGALAAFLTFNLPPAKIFLGDAGSMTIGLLLSALSVRACTDGPSNVVRILPVLALVALPLLDLVSAIGRRSLKGRSIFIPDRGHLHHCLKNRVGSTTAALGVAAGLAALGAGGATLAINKMGDLAACAALASSVGLLLGTNTFGAMESRLLFYRVRVALTLLTSRVAARGTPIGQECHVQGNRDWGGIRDALVSEGEACGIWRIELAIDMAHANEAYHVHWVLPAVSRGRSRWSIIHTIDAEGVTSGVIRVSGSVDTRSTPYLDRVERLVRVVEHRITSGGARIGSPEPSSLSGLELTRANTALM